MGAGLRIQVPLASPGQVRGPSWRSCDYGFYSIGVVAAPFLEKRHNEDTRYWNPDIPQFSLVLKNLV